MIADLMPPMYVAALYTASRLVHHRGNLRQGIVLDVLALNWLCCAIVQELVDYPTIIAAYMLIDLVSATWLSRNVRGKCAGIAEMFYLALILFNAAFFFAHAFSNWTHWTGLSIISWTQLLCVCGGILRHDIIEGFNRFAARFGFKPHLALGHRKAEK